ncbi:ATPase domain-containing protein [Noviherbaspirillum malthae]|jgi:circadian clock protein KaiC|uniref:ATPase domain-containing protein n=1 Tax=Noviherbaspirillum malthae TaxID=1260987 RepID=UPI001E532FED|nr:ATPase domain-containing protein [Noviherbaspirillum malthae]
MTKKVTLEKLPTGVPGLDTLLAGGIPKYSFNVITGSPGSGKTTLAHQIMFALANPKRKALFFTVMGEPPLKMLRYQQQYSFFDPGKVGPSIRYLNLAEDLQKEGFDGVLDRILKEVRDFEPELIFVDSFKSVVQATKDTVQSTASLQYFVQRLGIHLASWQATTFLLGEYAEAAQEENPIFTVADSIIHLSQEFEEDEMVRKIGVIKMRGTAHQTGLHRFRITDHGLQVFPRLLGGIVASRHNAPRAKSLGQRLSTGCTGLDDMLDGGLPAGYSTIVLGPPGCGKTMLGTSFLGAGARIGEHGIIVSFEHSLSHSVNTQLDALIEQGSVTEVRLTAHDLTVEELISALLDAVDRTGARRIVIDSLSALELVIAPQYRPQMLESLYRMLTHLHARAITVMMIRHVVNMTQPVFSQGDFIVDAIIAMRYAEIDYKLVKLISVPKLRASRHSAEVRSFKTTADGIELVDSI